MRLENKDHQMLQSNVVCFICIYFLLLNLEGQVKHVKLTGSLSYGAKVHSMSKLLL